jgi:amino acid transporter
VVELIGIPVLPFAIGVYLPVQLNACIMVGGLIRLITEKVIKNEDKKKKVTNDGILFCSGMIAGEGLVGILLALLAIFGVDKMLNLSALLGIPQIVSDIGGIVLFGLIILTVLMFSVFRKRKQADE